MNLPEQKCILCDGIAETNHPEGCSSDRVIFKCPRCGDYEAWDEEAEIQPAQDRWALSGFIRENTLKSRKRFYLDPYKYQEIINQHKGLCVLEKMEKLLNALSLSSPHPGSEIETKSAIDYPLAYCQNEDEFKYYMKELISTGDLSRASTTPRMSTIGGVGDKITAAQSTLKKGEVLKVVLTPKAWERLRSPGTNLNSNTVFLVRWFPGERDNENDRDNMKAYLKAVGEAIKESGFDWDGDLEGGINEKICDRIMAKIRQARFIVADTAFPKEKGCRANVYYEAGFAYGLNLPIIWTCRKDQLNKLPFDTRQYPHLDWDPGNMGDFQRDLKEKIIASLGRGSRRQNQDT